MRKRKIIAVFLIVFTVMLSSFTFYAYQLVYTPNVLINANEEEILSIDKGMTFEELQQRLGNGHVVNNLMAFSFVAKVMGYHENVQPGHYTLTPSMTNIEFVQYLRRGNPAVKVTFYNARRIENLAQTFSEHLLIDSAQFVQYIEKDEVQNTYGFDRRNIIGLFLPDTHEFFYKSSPELILNKMKALYDRFWTEDRRQKAENLGMSPQEVSVLASIVLGETAKLDEASRIAGVYKNRLDNGMRLQADPTLVFAQNDFTIRRVKKGDREIDSPYNTYMYKGLPPGPINMPPKSYIDAVLNIEDHEYLYFCADSDFNGYHIFAKNYNDHLKNARKLWRALNARKIDR